MADRGRRSRRDDVEHARGYARFVREFGQRKCRKRRQFRRLDHRGAAGRQCRRDLAGDHRNGEIPGRDRSSDADRLFERKETPAWDGSRDDIALDPLCLLGEPFDERSAIGDLASALRQRLALFERHQDGEILLVRRDQLEPAAQDPAAFLRGTAAPGRKGTVGGLDRAHRFRLAEIGHLGDHASIGRIADGKGGAAIGRDPLPVDRSLIAHEPGFMQVLVQERHLVLPSGSNARIRSLPKTR